MRKAATTAPAAAFDRQAMSVCTRECPRRTGDCHSYCKDYLEEAESNRRRREENLRQSAVSGFLADNSLNRTAKYQRSAKRSVKMKK